MHVPQLIASLRALYDVDTQDAPYNGIIVALGVPTLTARRAAIPGGLPADEMHVTLAYLGDAREHTDARPFLRLAGLLHNLAEHTPAVTAQFGGPGKFLGVNKGQDAAYLNVDAPALPALREAVVRAVQEAGLTVDMTHGFTPHVTLRYQDPGQPHPRETPVEGKWAFPTLGLWIGGNRVQFPLQATARSVVGAIVNTTLAPLVKADAPAGDARIQARALLAQLGGDLATLDVQDRAMQLRAEQIKAHHDQARDGLLAHIPAPRGSALEDAALHHAGEASGAAWAAQ